MIETQSRPTAVTSAGFSCSHTPCCPTADAFDRDAACTVSAHPEQGWSLLCNGIVVFDDLGELLPNGECIDACWDKLLAAVPHRV